MLDGFLWILDLFFIFKYKKLFAVQYQISIASIYRMYYFNRMQNNWEKNFFNYYLVEFYSTWIVILKVSSVY